MGRIENLRREIFVKTFEKKELPLLIRNLKKICKVDEDTGEVYLEINVLNKLNRTEKIKVVLAARYLCNKIEPNINEFLSTSEIASFTGGIPSNIVSARLSEMRNKGIVSTTPRGRYIISRPHVRSLLGTIISKYRL